MRSKSDLYVFHAITCSISTCYVVVYSGMHVPEAQNSICKLFAGIITKLLLTERDDARGHRFPYSKKRKKKFSAINLQPTENRKRNKENEISRPLQSNALELDYIYLEPGTFRLRTMLKNYDEGEMN